MSKKQAIRLAKSRRFQARRQEKLCLEPVIDCPEPGDLK
jgi:hypothetical protein